MMMVVVRVVCRIRDVCGCNFRLKRRIINDVDGGGGDVGCSCNFALNGAYK